MLKLSAFEFFARLVPEVLILIFAAYAFSRTKIDWKKYGISAILLGICVFTIRMLPINYGVHTLLNIIALTIIVSNINKIDTIEAIKSSILTTIFLFVCEGLNVLILNIVVGEKLDAIIVDPMLKTVYTMPSLIGLVIIIEVYYNNLKKRRKLKNV